MSIDARVLAPSKATPGAARDARTLVARTIRVASIDDVTRRTAFELFRAAYENTSRERFERDLAEKQRIILLRDRETRELKGFSTVHVQQFGRATMVFSGDTVIDRNYWGQKQLQLAFARLVVSLKLRAPWRPLYWFLVSKGYRTYLLLANSFPCAIPRFDYADSGLRAMLDLVAVQRFGAQYEPATSLVRYAIPHERVREGVAPVTSEALMNPHVRFFVEHNREHASGVELACLANVRLIDVARAVARIAGRKARRTSRDPHGQ